MKPEQRLESAWAKLRRANVHTIAFRDEWLAVRERERAMMSGRARHLDSRIVREEHIENEGAVWHLATIDISHPWTPDVGPDLGLIAGDVVTCQRAALDHLTWAMVQLHHGHPNAREARKIQFPMANSARSFEQRREERLLGIPSEDPFVALVKRYQPYRRGFGPSTIRRLRRFSDEDKHRVVTATPSGHMRANIVFQDAPGSLILGVKDLISGPQKPLKRGTRLFRLYVLTMVDTRGGVLIAPDQIVIAPLLATGVPAMQLFVNGSTVVREIIQATENLLRG